MSKTAISGVLWGSNTNKQWRMLTGTGAHPPHGRFEPVKADANNQRAIDLLDRARIRSARGRHNSEGFGE